MHPEIILRLGRAEFILQSYFLFTVLGAAVGITIAMIMLKRAGLSSACSLPLLICMALCFFIGARLLNRLVNPEAYGGTLHLYTLRLTGFSVYGGLAGALAALLLFAKLRRIKLWPLLDAMVLPAGIAFGIARVGCYLNGCCFGIPTDSCLGVVFPASDTAQSIISGVLSILGETELAVYPTQLFEMALALLGLVPALIIYFRGKSPPGTAFLLYSIWFAAMRWSILPLRSLSYPDVITKLIYPLFYAGTILIGIGFLLCIHLSDRKKQSP